MSTNSIALPSAAAWQSASLGSQVQAAGGIVGTAVGQLREGVSLEAGHMSVVGAGEGKSHLLDGKTIVSVSLVLL